MSNYPNEIDTDENLYLVHDSLRVKLAEDYNPGDVSITVYDEDNVISYFPPTGIITLTEQCSDIGLRALSFSYTSRTTTTFDGLVLLDGFTDCIKPKDITNVTLNVMAEHHNAIKDAVMAIQDFVGVEGTTDTEPFGTTIEGRLNFLRRLVLTPRAWFTADKTLGSVPLTITFTDECFRLGDNDVVYIWNFSDIISGISYISGISGISMSNLSTISVTDETVVVNNMRGGSLTKTFNQPGKYTIQLTVRNEFGEDTVIFDDMINARVAAPEEAVIRISPKSNQIWLTEPSPTDGPYDVLPVIRSPVGAQIDLSIPSGKRDDEDRSWAGEALSYREGGWVAVDPIEEYSWYISDEINHANSSDATALFSTGGEFDLVLRVDTLFGAYRITKYPNAFNIVELQNIWLWAFDGVSHASDEDSALDYLKLSGNIHSYEFGLLSESFKSASPHAQYILRNDEYLEDFNNAYQAKKEFRRNISATPVTTTPSGSRGSCLLYYADNAQDSNVQILEYQGFDDIYTERTPINRPWNWVCLNSPTKSYFLFGSVPTIPENNSYQVKSTLNKEDMSVTSETMTLSDYQNGAEELMEHPSTFDPDTGESLSGYFASYRTAWKDSSGYILRNSGVGGFFRFSDFYKTTGTVGEEFQAITKLNDMSGPVKVEGQLVALSDGVFFFNNNGNISAYNDTTGVWETGGVASSSVSFRSLQDSTVSGFDLASNTLLACSNGDRTAYLSYDYSQYAFIKFNSLELTFANIGPRPGWQDRTLSQFAMLMY